MRVKAASTLLVYAVAMILYQIHRADSIVFKSDRSLQTMRADSQSQCNPKCDFHALAFNQICCAWDSPQSIVYRKQEIAKRGYASTLDDLSRCIRDILNNITSLRAQLPWVCCNLLLFNGFRDACRNFNGGK